MSQHHDTAERVVTYGIGLGAMTLPQLLDGVTSAFTCLAAIGGFVLVCIRIRYEWKNRNKK